MNADGERALVKKFKTRSGYCLYETRSNRLLRVTPEMYAVLDEFMGLSEERIIHDSLSSEKTQKIEHAFSVLNDLSSKHGFFRPGPLERRVAPICKEAIASQIVNGAQMITLEATHACNLRCKYCIFSGGYEFARPHGTQHMSFDTAKAAVDFYLASRKQTDEISIGFYGGEPLLNFKVIQQCCHYAREAERKSGKNRRLRFSITTNGTLLDDEKISWLIDQEFAITVSCDGPAHIHDEHRIFPTGKGTFDKVFQSLQNIYHKNPLYYDSHVLINCVLCPCSNLMDIRDFFEEHDHLFANKLNISMVSEGNPLFFAQHPAYAARDEDLQSLHQEYMDAHIRDGNPRDLLHNSFARQLFEHDYLMFYRRPVFDRAIDPLDRVNTCFPGERKLFVDVGGGLHVCERVTHNFPIGDVWNGYDIDLMENMFNDFVVTMNSETCRNCWAVQMCPKCFTVGKDGKFTQAFQQEECPRYLDWLETVITNSCAVQEHNPSAFEYMDDYIIS